MRGLLLLLCFVTSVASARARDYLDWNEIRTVLSDSSLTSKWRDRFGNSPAFYHLRYGSEDRAIQYVRQQPRQKPHMEGRVRMLDLAASMGAQRMVAELLASGESPNGAAAGDHSALMLAAEKGHLEVMRLLLAAGADPMYSVAGYTAAHVALAADKEFAFRLLVDKGLDLARLRKDTSQNNLLFAALKGESYGGLQFLIASGFDVDRPRAEGSTPLHRAASSGHVEPIEILLQNGADPCLRDANHKLPSELFFEQERQRWSGVPDGYIGPFKNYPCKR